MEGGGGGGSKTNLNRSRSKSLQRSLSEVFRRNNEAANTHMNSMDDSINNIMPRRPTGKDSRGSSCYGELSPEDVDLLSTSAVQRFNTLFKTHGHKQLPHDILKSLQQASGMAPMKKKWWAAWKKDPKEPKEQLVLKIALCKSIEYASIPCEAETSFNLRRIPIVVFECINFLKANGLKSNGLFRVNGSERRMAQLAQIFDAGPKYGHECSFEGYTVYDVADFLKKYVRGLPEPLLTTDLYPFFLKCLELPVDGAQRVKGLRWLCMMLPPPHLVLLESLLELFALVVENASLNMMNSNNLARIFSPNLLRPKSEKQALEEFQSCSYVIEFRIENYEQFCITHKDIRPIETGEVASAPQTTDS
ncbi:hypothetical protein HDU76_002814, partial [Blyttiomyces sp. JEL0837]